jgi:hypothetical protein
LSVEEIKRLNRVYGHDVVNARLGYAKPEIQGMVRDVNIQMRGKYQGRPSSGHGYQFTVIGVAPLGSSGLGN